MSDNKSKSGLGMPSPYIPERNLRAKQNSRKKRKGRRDFADYYRQPLTAHHPHSVDSVDSRSIHHTTKVFLNANLTNPFYRFINAIPRMQTEGFLSHTDCFSLMSEGE